MFKTKPSRDTSLIAANPVAGAVKPRACGIKIHRLAILSNHIRYGTDERAAYLRDPEGYKKRKASYLETAITPIQADPSSPLSKPVSWRALTFIRNC